MYGWAEPKRMNQFNLFGVVCACVVFHQQSIEHTNYYSN